MHIIIPSPTKQHSNKNSSSAGNPIYPSWWIAHWNFRFEQLRRLEYIPPLSRYIQKHSLTTSYFHAFTLLELKTCLQLHYLWRGRTIWISPSTLHHLHKLHPNHQFSRVLVETKKNASLVAFRSFPRVTRRFLPRPCKPLSHLTNLTSVGHTRAKNRIIPGYPPWN